MSFPSDLKRVRAKIQAPFVLAEIRALRSSIFKKTQEVQSALAIAETVEREYELDRADLFIPAGDTWCRILEPFALTVLTGTLRRIGYEIFPQYISMLGIALPDVRTAMNLNTPADLVRTICSAYSTCMIGDDAGVLTPETLGANVTVYDSTLIPCQLQMGVFLGAGKLTGFFREDVLTERGCRNKGDSVCAYEFVF
jgi:hypothetical protein